MSNSFDPKRSVRSDKSRADKSEVDEIQSILKRLHRSIRMDDKVQQVTDDLRHFLQSDRVVLYYFYKQWEGRVTFESLSNRKYSILGSTGPDDCFNGEYAAMYLEGRVSAITDIRTADIASCHRDFLREINVQANLVAPILTGSNQQTLWGLLVAHHCQSTKPWTTADIEQITRGATELAQASSIKKDWQV